MSRIKQEIILPNNYKLLILAIFPSICLILSLIFGENLLGGYLKILKHPGLLISDFMFIGGLNSSLLNVSLVAFMNLGILYYLKIPINGFVFSAYFVSIGFASFGKTIFNMFPIYLGGLLYCYYERINFKNIFGLMMFSTGLAPLVSFLMFNKDFVISRGIIYGLVSGMIVGFTMPILSAHMLKFHEGYNLYNVGFTAGILGSLFASFIKGQGIEISGYSQLSFEYDFILKIILIFSFCIFIYIGYIVNKFSFKSYDELMATKGKIVSDFILTQGFGLSLINSGILGLLSLILISFLNTPLNGPLIAGIFTVFGFGAMGKHPLNCIPVVTGVVLASYIKVWEFDSFNVALSALFGTTLAPISGSFGPFIGVIAGFFHLFIVNNIGITHEGMNLYNNGFSGGLVAGIMIPFLKRMGKER